MFAYAAICHGVVNYRERRRRRRTAASGTEDDLQIALKSRYTVGTGAAAGTASSTPPGSGATTTTTTFTAREILSPRAIFTTSH